MRKDFQMVRETLDEIQQSARVADLNPPPQAVSEDEPGLVSFGEFATLLWQVETKQTRLREENNRMMGAKGKSTLNESSFREDLGKASAGQSPTLFDDQSRS